MIRDNVMEFVSSFGFGIAISNGSGSTVEGNVLRDCATGAIDLDSSSSSATLRDNVVRANGGPGLWTDLTAAHVAIVGNLVQGNSRSGIQVELSGQVVVADNVATDNGESGVWVLESNDVEVWHNHLGHNLRDLWIEDGPRTSPDATTDAVWDLLRVRAVGNVFADGSGTEALLNVDDWTERRGATAMKVSSDANAFWLPTSSSTRAVARWARWPDSLAISATLDEHRYSSRNDLASAWSTAATDPYVRDASALDYRAPTGAPVGLPLVDTVARALSLASGTVLPVGPVQSSDRRGFETDPGGGLKAHPVLKFQQACVQLPEQHCRRRCCRPFGGLAPVDYSHAPPFPREPFREKRACYSRADDDDFGVVNTIFTRRRGLHRLARLPHATPAPEARGAVIQSVHRRFPGPAHQRHRPQDVAGLARRVC